MFSGKLPSPTEQDEPGRGQKGCRSPQGTEEGLGLRSLEEGWGDSIFLKLLGIDRTCHLLNEISQVVHVLEGAFVGLRSWEF